MPSTSLFTFPQAVRAVRAAELTAQEATDKLLGQLTQRELLWLLDGDVPAWKMVGLPKIIRSGAVPAGALPRIEYPGIRFSDGPRGVTVGQATAFPVSMARAATWDPQLEQQVGTVIGLEARAKGANYSGAVCINLVRHPAWGRAQESYGEDPVLIGQMGAGLTRGLRPNVMACVKHFALNSMENMRFAVDVTVDEAALHEVYLPHFKTVIDAGADSVMSAYNSANGAFLGENAPLLTDVLRDEWGFEGAVTSDWVFGVHDGIESLEAGLDVEMPLHRLRAKVLPRALREGRVSRELVLRSARRVLGMTLRHAVQQAPETPGTDVVARPEHVALAREIAVESMVLLQNDEVDSAPLLPLARGQKIAVIGALADEPNLGDHGSSQVKAPTTSSPLAGIREAFGEADVVYDDGTDVDRAVALARATDTVIILAGLGHDDEGERIWNEPDPADAKFPMTLPPLRALSEKLGKILAGQFGKGGDRSSLTLHDHDENLIRAVAQANPRTGVVLIGGSTLIIENWRREVPAILVAWYPGMEGGRALGDILTGAREPGGRLPFTIPTDAHHLPFFDAAAKQITYDEWWGQRKLDHDGHAAAFPLGYGLGYTTFEVTLVDDGSLPAEASATVRVANTGLRAGSTVVQLYALDVSAERPIPQLVGFQRVRLEAGVDTQITVPLDLTPTLTRNPETRTWSVRPGDWRITAEQHSPVPAFARVAGGE